jgi:hypothetical protein
MTLPAHKLAENWPRQQLSPMAFLFPTLLFAVGMAGFGMISSLHTLYQLA